MTMDKALLEGGYKDLSIAYKLTLSRIEEILFNIDMSLQQSTSVATFPTGQISPDTDEYLLVKLTWVVPRARTGIKYLVMTGKIKKLSDLCNYSRI